MKHEAGWQPVKHPDGITTWRSPTGHTYTRPPDDLPVDTTMQAAPWLTPGIDAETDSDPPPF